MKKQIDFTKFPIIDVEGNVIGDKDLAKEIANLIYNQTTDVAEAELAMRLVREKSLPLEESEIEIIKNNLNKGEGVFAYIKIGFNKLVENSKEVEE